VRSFRKVRRRPDQSNMLQINNILHALAEAKHSLDQIIESAMDLTPVSRVNNDNNVETFCKVCGWD
jgi:hypothetical protein